MKKFALLFLFAFFYSGVYGQNKIFDNTAQPLPFSQNWTNTSLITVDDDWSGVPGITGYSGDDLLHTPTGVDPQTIVADGTDTVDVNANKTNPNTFTSGGVAEFEINGSCSCIAGFRYSRCSIYIISIVTTGKENIRVQYNLRDIDGSADNAIQQVALQYRVGTSGDFTNVAAGYVADASTGPSLATLVTAVDVTLPSAVNNQAVIQIRIITTNAAGSDEWIGIDDISITGSAVGSNAISHWYCVHSPILYKLY